jgi:hypothetical protein
MRKILLLIGGLLSSMALFAQTYNFSNNPVAGGWTVVNTNNSNGAGISWDGSSGVLQYDLQSGDLADVGTNKYFFTRPTPYTLGDQFSVSFKIRPEAGHQNNSIFPLLLTPNALAGPNNNHPWRLDYVNPNVGNPQNLNLLGVAVVNNEVRLVARLGNAAAGVLIPFATPYTLTGDTDYWIKLERMCPTSVRLSVYTNSAMTTPAVQQLFTIPTLGNLNTMYIANCNGNAGMDQRCTVDDYTFGEPDITCCSPNAITGPTTICRTTVTGNFSVDVSGDNIQDMDWSVSPAGPTLVENGNQLTVTNWGAPGTYTIKFSWTCNCVMQTLTKVVTVLPGFNANDFTSTGTSCTTPVNSLNFGFTSTAVPGASILWTVTQAANFTPGDYNVVGGTLYTQTTGSTLAQTGWNRNFAYVITVSRWFEGTDCSPQTLTFKVSCQPKSGLAENTVSEAVDNSNLTVPVIYPNPTAKDLFIQLPAAHSITKLRIIDGNGKTMITKALGEDQQRAELSIEHLPAGIYTIVYEGNGVFAPDKFVKE